MEIRQKENGDLEDVGDGSEKPFKMNAWYDPTKNSIRFDIYTRLVKDKLILKHPDMFPDVFVAKAKAYFERNGYTVNKLIDTREQVLEEW